MTRLPIYIFFDCMETLLGFEEKPPLWQEMGKTAYELGVCESAEEFALEFINLRGIRIQSNEEKETTLQDRFLNQMLQNRKPHNSFSQDKVVSQLISAYVKEYISYTFLEPGVEAMLEAWQGKVPMGVVSNFILQGMPDKLLRHYSLDRYFDFILDSATIGWRKPSRKIYLYALGLAGIQQNQIHNVWFIGDDPLKDVEAPLKLGMRAIHYAKGKDKSPDVATISHWDDFRPERMIILK